MSAVLDSINDHINGLGGTAAALAAISLLMIKVYSTARRIDQAIGVDEDGRTLSDRMGVVETHIGIGEGEAGSLSISKRMERVEYQVFPNGGKSMADRMVRVEKIGIETSTEVRLIRDLLTIIVGRDHVPKLQDRQEIEE